MSVVITTNYSGEVLDALLTRATLGNEIASKGLICVIPNVRDSISIPRLTTGKMLRKHIAQPDVDSAKGDFNLSEKKLTPRDMMAFTIFNPRAFEHYWKKYQPTGELVFAELPPLAQNAMLEAMSKQVNFELGDLYINGEYVENGSDEQLMDGILTQAAKDENVIVVESAEETMLLKLAAVKKAIPKAIRNMPSLRILMSVDDFDKYDDELTQREAKNVNDTDVNPKRYKGITIETLAQWPDGVIMATLCSPGYDGNLFAAVSLKEDENVIKIGPVSNYGEEYFFKMLMKADTNIAFGEETVVLDTRAQPVFVAPAEEAEGEAEAGA